MLLFTYKDPICNFSGHSLHHGRRREGQLILQPNELESIQKLTGS